MDSSELLKGVLPAYPMLSEAPHFRDMAESQRRQEARRLYKSIDSEGRVWLVNNPTLANYERSNDPYPHQVLPRVRRYMMQLSKPGPAAPRGAEPMTPRAGRF